MAEPARRWAALDLVARPRTASPNGHAGGHSHGSPQDSPDGPTTPPIEGLLEAFLDDYAPTAIVDPPVSPPEPLSADARAWRVFFATAEARDRAHAALAASAWQATLDITPIDVDDENWAARSQATLTAIQVGRLIIAPPWDRPAIAPGTVAPPLVIVIEPSMGFGTGHHQSTRLCLHALQAIEIAGRTVLDLGTGSGVLAIAAAKLGAASVVGIDEDPDAAEAAHENVTLNDVWGIVTVACADLTGRADASDRADRASQADWSIGVSSPADIVLANLTGTLLARYAEAIVRHAVAGGLLILSGFTEDERVSVAHAFRDLEVVDEAREDGWIGLTLRRP